MRLGSVNGSGASSFLASLAQSVPDAVQTKRAVGSVFENQLGGKTGLCAVPWCPLTGGQTTPLRTERVRGIRGRFRPLCKPEDAGTMPSSSSLLGRMRRSCALSGLAASPFYAEAVTANTTAYGFVPAHVRHGPFKRQLALLALRDPKMWRLLPSSCDDVSAYLDALESRPEPRRAAAEVWHTRAPPSLLVHMQHSHVASCRDLVLRAVARCWRDLRYAAWNLRSDRAVVSAAVACHWRALQFASFELRGTRSSCGAPSSRTGWRSALLRWPFGPTRGLARLAVRTQPRALQYVDLSLVAKWKRERAAGSDEVRGEPPKG